MINPKSPASPILDAAYSEHSNQYWLELQDAGMDIRTKIAAMAMQGIMAADVDLDDDELQAETVARISVRYADALIKELNKEG